MPALQRVNELVEAAEKAVDFVYRNGIDVIVLPGSSVKPMDVVMRQIWREKYSRPFPRIIALGTINKSRPYREEYYSGKEEAKITGRKNIKKKILRSTGEMDIQRIVNKRFKNLLITGKIKKTDKLMVLDEHSLTAGSIADTKKALQNLGFLRIKTGTLIHEKSNGLKLKLVPDFVGAVSMNRALYERRRKFLAGVINSRGRLIKDRLKKSIVRKRLKNDRTALLKITKKRTQKKPR